MVSSVRGASKRKHQMVPRPPASLRPARKQSFERGAYARDMQQQHRPSTCFAQENYTAQDAAANEEPVLNEGLLIASSSPSDARTLQVIGNFPAELLVNSWLPHQQQQKHPSSSTSISSSSSSLSSAAVPSLAPASAISLLKLPCSLVLDCLSFCNAADLSSIAGTCSALNVISSCDETWQRMFHILVNTLSLPHQVSAGYKRHFIHISESMGFIADSKRSGAARPTINRRPNRPGSDMIREHQTAPVKKPRISNSSEFLKDRGSITCG